MEAAGRTGGKGADAPKAASPQEIPPPPPASPLGGTFVAPTEPQLATYCQATREVHTIHAVDWVRSRLQDDEHCGNGRACGTDRDDRSAASQTKNRATPFPARAVVSGRLVRLH